MKEGQGRARKFFHCLIKIKEPYIRTLHNVCAVHRGVCSTLGDVQYTGGCSVHWGVIMSTVGDTMSTPGDVQYTGVTMSTAGGYHEYTGGCSVHRDIMSTPGGYHEYTGGLP